ncbi:MAG: CoA transferase [Dehalococcoidia bacterium]|nr:CoA transferase [Dehalococcoidia bacterium]
MVAPLTGIRVIEVANYVAGPSVGGLMSDLGAEVIKVEPPGGEAMRASVSGGQRAAFLFDLENRGKKSVTIALDREGGPDLVHALLERSDVLLTNLIAPRLQKYGLMPGDVHSRNPHVIHVSVTGYGIEGPDAGRPAFDFAAFWARSGIISVVGHPGAPPVISRIAQGDHTTGITGLAAVFAALRLRDQTGEGQTVEVTLQRTGVFTIGTDIARVLIDGKQPSRFDRTAPYNPLFNTYPTRDGSWVMLVHMTPDPYWPKLCAALGESGWANDPRYTTMAGRSEHGSALSAAIEAHMVARDLAEWASIFDAHGLIWAPMAQLPDVVRDPQLRAQEAFATVGEGDAAFETVAVPFRIRDADVRPRGPSAEAGEHTIEVLRAAGIADDRIAELAAHGVFG